jgi:two-component sensor histidine kinase
LQYLFTATGVAILGVIRATLITDLVPWLLFVPFILVVSLAYGRGPALFGLALAALAAAVTLAGRLSEALAATQFWAATGVFCAVGVMTIELGHSLRASFERHLHAEAQLQMLNLELAHRLKNNLAMVQAIVFQTLRQPISAREAQDAINERLVALGRATDLLTQTSWEATDLRRIVESVAKALDRGRFNIEGPAVGVGAQQALALSLAFHELATNAAKYGSLSSESGSVAVRWVQPAPDFIHLTWEERGGPTVVAPTKRGFGSTLIEQSLRSYLPGTASLDFRPDGLRFTLEGSLAPAGS